MKEKSDLYRTPVATPAADFLSGVMVPDAKVVSDCSP